MVVDDLIAVAEEWRISMTTMSLIIPATQATMSQQRGHPVTRRGGGPGAAHRGGIPSETLVTTVMMKVSNAVVELVTAKQIQIDMDVLPSLDHVIMPLRCLPITASSRYWWDV